MNLVIGKEVRAEDNCDVFELTIHHMRGNDDCAQIVDYEALYVDSRGVLFHVPLNEE